MATGANPFFTPNPTFTPIGNNGTQVSTTNYQSSYDQAGGQTGAQNQNQQNEYTGGQSALEGQLPMMYSKLLQGQVPTSFTSPQVAFDNFDQSFENTEAPQLAAQFGAGSPQLASQLALGNQNMAAQMYQQGLNNYEGALSGGSSNALTAVGSSGNSAYGATDQGQGDTTGQSISSISPTILSALMNGMLAKAFQAF